MKREYNTGTDDKASLFVGTEVEHTEAYGLKTLFVVGVQDVEKIKQVFWQNDCQHLYIGANQSFEANKTWDYFLTKIKTLCDDYLDCLYTVDFEVSDLPWFLETICAEDDNCIPMISVKMPYIKLLNYNATIKIDDTDFNATNPGVWCHRVHDLMASDKFTNWHKYKDDEIKE